MEESTGILEIKCTIVERRKQNAVTIEMKGASNEDLENGYLKQHDSVHKS